MATEGSAERPDIPASRYLPGSGAVSGSSPPENEAEKCLEGQFGGTSPCGHPACPIRRAGSEERLLRRSEPERSGSRRGRRDCDTRKGWCVYRFTATYSPLTERRRRLRVPPTGGRNRERTGRSPAAELGSKFPGGSGRGPDRLDV